MPSFDGATLKVSDAHAHAQLLRVLGGRDGEASVDQGAAASAFPTAEGFGTDTEGGRGGQVIRVTNLNGSGAGSFRTALTTTGPRIIVFATSGTIDLGGTISLTSAMSDVTVLGQTSPGGITITGGVIEAYQPSDGIFHDAIFRYLRFRRQPSTFGDDTISFTGGHHYVFDHVDFSGGADETFDVTKSSDWTLQWSTVTNSLSEGGNVNYGSLVAYQPTSSVTLHHNFHANHNARCGAQLHWENNGGSAPPAGGAQLDIRNNVVYNCVFAHLFRVDNAPAVGVDLNLVGNVGKLGPDSTGSQQIIGGISANQGDFYVSGNQFTGGSTGLTTEVPEHDYPDVTTTTAAQAIIDVTNCAGSWPRDAMNIRTIEQFEASTGSIGDVSDDLYSTAPTVPTDTDGDGLPNTWESANGRNPNVADSAVIDSGTGYAWIEVYANELAAAYMADCTLPTWLQTQADKTWTQPSSNTISAVQPSPLPSGGSGAQGLFAYSGGFVSNESEFRIFGGGHTDYCGNEQYVIDFSDNSPAWTRLTNFSTCSGGSAVAYGDGNIRTPHTRGAMAYDSTTNAWFMCGQAGPYPSGDTYMDVWKYDLDDSAWTNLGSLSGINSQWIVGAHRANDGFIYCTGIYGSVWRVNPSTGALSTYNSNEATEADYHTVTTYVPETNSIVLLTGEQLYALDLDSGSIAWDSLGEAGVSLAGFNEGGFQWHSRSRKIIAWGGGTPRTTVHTISPPVAAVDDHNDLEGTWTVAAVTAAASNTITPSAEESRGTFSRFNILTIGSRDVLVLNNAVNEKPYIYLLPEGGL